jgi:hypothetical protein
VGEVNDQISVMCDLMGICLSFVMRFVSYMLE